MHTLMVDSPIRGHQYERWDPGEPLRVDVRVEQQEIPMWAFAIVESLVEVRLNPHIQTIADNAFFSCKRLASINLSNIESVGESSFKSTSLQEINLSKAITIKEFAFANCNELRIVKLSRKLKSIGDFAFSGDLALVACHIPAGQIGTGAFMGCTNLKEVSFGKVSKIENAAFLDCTSLIKVEIPSSVMSIGNEAFVGCVNLKYAIIGSRNTEIAEGAFEKGVMIKYK